MRHSLWFLLAVMLSYAMPGVAPARAADCTTLSGNLVANCSFETGDFSGWTLNDDTTDIGVTAGSWDGALPTQGEFQAYFGAVGSTTSLSQTLATTVGGWYTITFDLARAAQGEGCQSDCCESGCGCEGDCGCDPGCDVGRTDAAARDITASAGAEVIWEGNTIFSLLDPDGFNYAPQSFQVQAAGSPSLLNFQFRNDPDYFELDNIAVVASAVATPEPSTLAIMAASLGLLAFRRRARG